MHSDCDSSRQLRRGGCTCRYRSWCRVFYVCCVFLCKCTQTVTPAGSCAGAGAHAGTGVGVESSTCVKCVSLQVHSDCDSSRQLCRGRSTCRADPMHGMHRPASKSLVTATNSCARTGLHARFNKSVEVQDQNIISCNKRICNETLPNVCLRMEADKYQCLLGISHLLIEFLRKSSSPTQ